MQGDIYYYHLFAGLNCFNYGRGGQTCSELRVVMGNKKRLCTFFASDCCKTCRKYKLIVNAGMRTVCVPPFIFANTEHRKPYLTRDYNLCNIGPDTLLVLSQHTVQLVSYPAHFYN